MSHRRSTMRTGPRLIHVTHVSDDLIMVISVVRMKESSLIIPGSSACALKVVQS